MRNCQKKAAAQFRFVWIWAFFAFLIVSCRFLPALADTLKLPADLRNIEEEAFCGNQSLDNVILQEGVQVIGQRAFAECTINQISLPESITFIDETAFTETKIDQIVAIPGSYAFDWMVRHKFIQPWIRVYSEEESVVSGETVTLYSEAESLSGTTLYQWQRSADGLVWNNTDFSENNGETLTFQATPDTMKYYYHCQVLDNNGYWYSNPVRVQLAPRIAASTDRTRAMSGEYVNFSVSVTDAKGMCAYQWQYGLDGKNWYDITTISGADRDVFSLYSSEQNLAYLYRCAVTDDNGVWYSNALSVAFSSLRIISHPQFQTVVVDDLVTISVEADGSAPLTYQWQVRYPSEQDWRDSVTNGNKTSQIQFYAGENQSGIQYRCCITNCYGDSLYTDVAVITVTPKPVYRAAIIAMGNFLRQDSVIPTNHDYFIHYGYDKPYFYVESINRNYGDAQRMCWLLDHVYGGKTSGVKYSFKWFQDPSYYTIQRIIQQEFANTNDYDVSLFFIATHGYSDGDGDLEMPFQGALNQADIEAHKQGYKSLSFDTLAAWLKQYVKGEVIVIIESCGSGSAIYSTSAEQNAVLGKSVDDGEAFVSRAITAFAKADTVSETKNRDFANGTGALRMNKFYVLASSRHQEMSWGNENGNYNYFTKWLSEGVGSSGNMPADTNGDGVVDLTELFNYIKKNDTKPITKDGISYYQHVQRYPVGSTYPLFR